MGCLHVGTAFCFVNKLNPYFVCISHYFHGCKHYNVESLKQLLPEDRFSIVFDCGSSTSSTPITKATVDHISSIIKAVSLHCVLRVKAEIDQIAEGLELFNVFKLIRKYPAKIQGMLICNPQ